MGPDTCDGDRMIPSSARIAPFALVELERARPCFVPAHPANRAGRPCLLWAERRLEDVSILGSPARPTASGKAVATSSSSPADSSSRYQTDRGLSRFIIRDRTLLNWASCLFLWIGHQHRDRRLLAACIPNSQSQWALHPSRLPVRPPRSRRPTPLAERVLRVPCP